MSQLLQVATRGGGPIVVTVGTLAPDHFSSGIPYEADGTLAVASGQLVDHYHQGLPFGVTGRLAILVNAAVTHYGSGAAPFAGLHLAVSSGGLDHYSAGIPYAIGGQIAIAGP